jgi:hypothetical protein
MNEVASKFRAASFSVSGSPASGLLLFLWDGGESCFLDREPFKNKTIEALK